jgi:hypothetical protein
MGVVELSLPMSLDGSSPRGIPATRSRSARVMTVFCGPVANGG